MFFMTDHMRLRDWQCCLPWCPWRDYRRRHRNDDRDARAHNRCASICPHIDSKRATCDCFIYGKQGPFLGDPWSRR